MQLKFNKMVNFETIGGSNMKLFRCWYLTKTIGWLYFEKEFNSKEDAIAYCESKTEFKGSSIVEEA